jgi:hypothetical protein
MSEEEFQATYGGGWSPYTGTANHQMPAMPTELEHPYYPVFYKAPIALACQGKTLVRSVFKMVKQPFAEQVCAGIHLLSGSDLLVRCLLELPSGAGSENERATKAKEVKCWRCQECDDKSNTGCPSVQGAWYSDTYITQAEGCGFDRSKGWSFQMAEMWVKSRHTALVVKFEVCNDPGCFNQAHEEAKLANALTCDRRVSKTC